MAASPRVPGSTQDRIRETLNFYFGGMEFMICNFVKLLGAGWAFPLAVLSAAITFPASATAATQQQCDTLKTLLRNTVEFEKTVAAQGVAVTRQRPILAGAALALQAKYKELDKADLQGILDVADRLGASAEALDKGFDARVKVLNDSVTVIGDLCR
jgi:hypothetical protein